MKLFSMLLISAIPAMPLIASEPEAETDVKNLFVDEMDDRSVSLAHFISMSFSNAILSDSIDAFIRTAEHAKKVGYADELLLHRAISNDAKKITAFLINYGADLTFLSDNFSSPLLTAIMLKKCWAVSLLIEGGANINEIVYWPGKPIRLISDYASADRCMLDAMINSGAILGELAEFAKANKEEVLRASILHKFRRDSEASWRLAGKVLLSAVSAFAIKKLYHLLREYDVKPRRLWRSDPRPPRLPETNAPKKPRLGPSPIAPFIAGEVLSFMPDFGNSVQSSDKNIRHLVEAIRDAMNNNDIVSVNRHLADLRDQLKTHELRENLRKAIHALISEIETFSGPLSAAAIIDTDALSQVRQTISRRESVMPDEAPAAAIVDEVRDTGGIREVRFARGALNEVPEQLMAKVLEWQNLVEENGLHASRQDSSLNDEAVFGTDLRSVRLNHKYRLFYRVVRGEGAPYVRVTTVNPHQYQRAKNG